MQVVSSGLPQQPATATPQAAATSCSFAFAATPNGAGLASADLRCSSPLGPVPVAGAADLARFAPGFQGVAFSTAASDQGAFLQFTNIPQVLPSALLPVCICRCVLLWTARKTVITFGNMDGY